MPFKQQFKNYIYDEHFKTPASTSHYYCVQSLLTEYCRK